MMYGMECGHRFCVQCWNEYLTTKIMEEGMGQTIACAAHNCPILVDDATVMKLLTDPKVKLKYQHLITNSFVQVSSFSIRYYAIIALCQCSFYFVNYEKCQSFFFNFSATD